VLGVGALFVKGASPDVKMEKPGEEAADRGPLRPIVSPMERERPADPAFSSSRIVVNHILQGLRQGRYVPGQTLVAAELMKELGLSKAPVREALHLLVGEGVIELLQNRSVRITRLDADDVRGFVAVWSTLGATSLRLAAEAIAAEGITSGADGRVLAARIAEVERAAGRGITYEFLMSIADYHCAAAAIGGNLFIRRFIGLAHFEHTHRHMASLMPALPFREYAQRFCGVHDAVIAGAGGQAERLFQEHMAWVTRLLQGH